MTDRFGDRLLLAMQRKKWNARELAKRAGVNEATVSRHLKEEKPPKHESVAKYRAALGVSHSWLAYGREDEVTPPMVETLERILGAAALERVLGVYEWPDVDIAIVDAVCADARTEAFEQGKDRPESAWRLRVTQLLRERRARR